LIVRELWAYQLAISPLPSTPDVERSSTSPIPLDPEEKEDDKGEEDAETESSGSSSAVDLEAELLSGLSDGSKGDEEDLQDMDGAGLGKRDVRWRRKRRLRISDVVVTLVLGLWVLRMPILLVDIGE
jgi:RNA polymerase I-specific transcription initiation factor RRN7